MDVAIASRAGRPAWLNRRTVFGAVLLVASLAGGRAVLSSADATTPVWVASRSLAGGSRVTADSLRIEQVQLPPRLAPAYVRAGERIEGYVLTRPVAAGELLPENSVVPQAPQAGRAVTVPVDPEHAVGGALVPGDLVDVFATFETGGRVTRTVALVRQVEVIDVVTAGGMVMGQEAVVGITISVSPEDAQRVAFAARSGELDIARVEDPSQVGGGGAVRSSDL